MALQRTRLISTVLEDVVVRIRLITSIGGPCVHRHPSPFIRQLAMKLGRDADKAKDLIARAELCRGSSIKHTEMRLLQHLYRSRRRAIRLQRLLDLIV